MAYQIFTDATSDLSKDLLRDRDGLTVIPMEVLVGEESYLHGEENALTPDGFYARLRKGAFASTSQITPDRFASAFRPVLEKGEDLVYFGFSSGLSGTFNSAQVAKQMLEEDFPDRTIVCVDTLSASIGLGLFVMEALKKKEEGLSLTELCDYMTAKCPHVCHRFIVDTFDHLKHGGRVSAAAAAIGTVLNIKPLLMLGDEGKLEVLSKPRGTKQAIRMMLSHMQELWLSEENRTVLVAHGDNKEGAKELTLALQEQFPDAQILQSEIGPVIGSHTGPGMLALTFWGLRR